MATMKTPGVYIVEKDAFPNSVVEVATAVPAFIGYTEKADNQGRLITDKPWKITSAGEFHNYYGGAPKPTFNIVNKTVEPKSEFDFTHSGTHYYLEPTKQQYLLYRSMLLFFQNGGGPCFIVSIGGYNKDGSLDADKFIDALILLKKEQEPTMIIMPETVLLNRQDSKRVQVAALKHCGVDMKNRISIFDIRGGNKDQEDPSDNCITNFRNDIGINHLKFATVYYPWLNTSIVQDKELGYENIDNAATLRDLLIDELDISSETNETLKAKKIEQQETIKTIVNDWVSEAAAAKLQADVKEKDLATKPEDEAKKAAFNKAVKAANDADVAPKKTRLAESLAAMNSPLYNSVLNSIKEKLNLLPPAAAIAGVYTMVDNSRGVWKAPANVSLTAVVSPAVDITHYDQETLNVDVNGKSINAIRSFIGEGTLVWGARTLDGNSLDWRYINVCRTVIMLEESIRLASKAYVFEPNVANTWVTIESMIRNFLTEIWKRGGLAGTVPEDAFSVHVGLGETMTAEDILEGILRITVLVAVSRPAEFIEISFQQQMQKS